MIRTISPLLGTFYGAMDLSTSSQMFIREVTADLLKALSFNRSDVRWRGSTPTNILPLLFRRRYRQGKLKRSCREQINLAGLGDTSCGRSLLFCPAEERCLRLAFPGETVRTISRRRPGLPAGAAHRGCQGWPRPGRGHRVAARSVLDGPEHGARLTAGGNDDFALAMARMRIAKRNPVAIVTAQAQPAMEDRQPAVRVLMYLHRRLNEVSAQGTLRDL